MVSRLAEMVGGGRSTGRVNELMTSGRCGDAEYMAPGPGGLCEGGGSSRVGVLTGGKAVWRSDAGDEDAEC